MFRIDATLSHCALPSSLELLRQLALYVAERETLKLASQVFEDWQIDLNPKNRYAKSGSRKEVSPQVRSVNGDHEEVISSVITSKAAMREQVKTGHRKPSGTKFFYPAAGSAGKSVFVRQLRGPHFSRCPWWRRRSSMALTAAASPSNLPQSSTGRLEVTSVLARS
jgi:hypothetical protein